MLKKFMFFIALLNCAVNLNCSAAQNSLLNLLQTHGLNLGDRIIFLEDISNQNHFAKNHVGVNNERATKISANPTHNTPLHVGKSGFIIDCNAEYIRDTSDNGVLTTSRNLYNKICTFIPHNTNPVLTSEMSGSRVVATFNVRLPTNPFLSTVRVLDPDIGHNGSINANLNVTAQNGAHANLPITPNATSMKVVFVKRITGVNNQLHAAILTFYPNS